jgi:hypothetical protein
MAVDYGILERTPSIASRFMAGRQEAAAEQDRNMLRQAQMEQMGAQRENILAQREQRMAQAEERRLLEARRQQAQEAMARFSDTFARAGYEFNRTTLGDMFNVGRETGNESLLKTAIEGLKALDDDERFNAELGRLGLRPAPVPANAMAPSAESAPAPVNAMAPSAEGAPAPVNAMVDRSRVQQMIMSTSPRVRQMGQALAGTLEKPEASPAEVREYEYAVGQGYPGTFLDFKREMAIAKRPPGTTVVVPPQEKAERGARGKMLVDQYQGIATAAQVASRALPALETQERVLDTGFRTGFGAEAQTVAARVLSALGVENAKDYAKNSEGFSAAASQAVLQRQLEQKGVQTEADAQRISQTGAQLGNTPEGNRFIIAVARAQFKRDIEQRNFYDKWWKANNTYDGAEDAWFSGPGSKSLFDSSELKQFAAPKPDTKRPSLDSIFGKPK